MNKILKDLAPWLIALGVGLLFWGMDTLGFSAIYESKLLDLRFMLRGALSSESPSTRPDDPVLIVAIDDQAIAGLNRRWPWARSLYAKAVDNLSQAGAKVIAFDLIFSESDSTSQSSGNRKFGEAIDRSRAWIVLGSKFYTKNTDLGQETALVSAIPQLDQGKTHIGYVNYWADQDGVLRNAALLRRHQGQLYQSFVLKVLGRYWHLDQPQVQLKDGSLRFGRERIPVDRGANLLINYRGGPGNFRTLSFENLVSDEIFPALRQQKVFKDKIVLIGPTFTEAQDNQVTPFFRAFSLTPGVEVHANVLATILEHKYLKTSQPWENLFLFLLLPLALTYFAFRLKPLPSLGVLAAAFLLYVVVAFFCFIQFHYVVPIFNLLLAMVITHLGTLVRRLVVEEFQTRRIKLLFSRYVSPKVVEQLVHDPSHELKLGGEKMRITVLFSDIRGFTTLSEQLPPEHVVELLNEYFETMTEVIFRHDGMVDKFIGDAIMAIFGAPVAHPDDPARAVAAALDMRAALQTLLVRWKTQGKSTFDIGIGINTGEAIVGNMGSHQAMGYTAIGDTVNLASRLEGKNKDLGTSILISESTYAAVQHLVKVQAFAEVTVKGKAQSLTAYAVLGLAETPPPAATP